MFFALYLGVDEFPLAIFACLKYWANTFSADFFIVW